MAPEVSGPGQVVSSSCLGSFGMGVAEAPQATDEATLVPRLHRRSEVFNRAKGVGCEKLLPKTTVLPKARLRTRIEEKNPIRG